MTDEEKILRSKFYLAPKETTLEELRSLNKEFPAYPGLTKEQADKAYAEIKKFKDSLDPDGVKVVRS